MALATFVLTVSESKRLIAKGVAALPCVKQAMQSGFVAVGKGTTNAYVLEELLGRPVEKTGYVLGATIPAKGKARASLLPASIPEVVFRNGEAVEGLTLQEALKSMGPGDVVIKGANALDYAKRLAGVLIQHPEGGTMGLITGRAHGRKIRIVIPVGLEKQVVSDLRAGEAALLAAGADASTSPALWTMTGEIVTELEALRMLTGCEVTQIAAGGIGGAEGAVWLMANGTPEQVAAATALVDSTQGEPPFAAG
jgi:hypothetical protein